MLKQSAVPKITRLASCRIVMPEEPEAVLLGGALKGSVAAGKYANITDTMKTICHAGGIVEPDNTSKSYHDIKYLIFADM